MKRIFLIIIGLCLCTALYADMNTYIIGSGSAGGGATISDSFGTDTSENYTAIINGITISEGVAIGASTWDTNVVYHETALESVDHYVQAVCTEDDYDGGGIIARCDGTHYYKTVWDGNLLRLYRDTTYISASYDGGYLSSSGTHTLKMSVEGSGATVTIKVYIDGVLRIEKADTESGRLTSGSYVGMSFDLESSGSATDSAIDDFEAGEL